MLTRDMLVKITPDWEIMAAKIEEDEAMRNNLGAGRASEENALPFFR